jgi:virginiamycin B lyase
VVHVSDRQRHCRITVDGLISTYPVRTPRSGVADLTPGSDGAVWFTEQNVGQVGRITTDGVVTEYPAGPGAMPHDITTTARGIWFTNSPYVNRIRLANDLP